MLVALCVRVFRFLHIGGFPDPHRVAAVPRTPLCAIAVFSLEQTAARFGCGGSPLVGSNGLEPSTSRLSGVRSNHLSYEPVLQPIVSNQPDVAANTLAYLRSFSRSENLLWPFVVPSGQTIFGFAPSHSATTVFPFVQTAARLGSAPRRGGDEQNRTVDPLLARQVLSQLSYAPVLGLCLGESTLLSSLEGPQN